jgi:peptidoglycan/LPS O-acetylase OafA/YrhL
LLSYRPEIDGLRAVAVIPVILFHAGFKFCEGGFVGVDIFFVISGYLITSKVLLGKEVGNFSWVGFYESRARRILPPLFVMMLACFAYEFIYLFPSDMRDFLQTVAAASAFCSNLLFYAKNNYFDSASELRPLIHTWSLSIEEQFYILFPLIFMLRVSRSRLYICIAVLLLSFCLAEWGSRLHSDFAFYLLPSRAWELLVGCVAGMMLYYSKRALWSNFIKEDYLLKAIYEIISIIGLLLITTSIIVFDRQSHIPGISVIMPVTGTALIILFSHHDTLIFKFLSNNILATIGALSYSLYLWHQPVLAFAKLEGRDVTQFYNFSIIAAALGAISYLSWRYVERVSRNRNIFGRWQIFIACGLMSLLFIVTGIFNHFLDNPVGASMAARLDEKQKDIYAFRSYQPEALYRVGSCFLRLDQSYKDFSSDCSKRREHPSSAFIWGDSHAAALSIGLRSIFDDVVQYTASSCPPIDYLFPGLDLRCREINKFVFGEIGRIQPKTIYMHANWIGYAGKDFIARLKMTVKHIHEISPSSRIRLIGGVPQWRPNLPEALLRKGISADEGSLLETPAYNELHRFDEQFRNERGPAWLEFISPIETLCVGHECPAVIEVLGSFTLFCFDYGHLTEGGSIFLAQKLFLEGSG